MLGAPVGSVVLEDETIQARIDKVEHLLAKLHLLEDPHTEYALLRNCIAISKLSYTMRTVDPCQHKETLARFDTLVRHSL